MRSLNILAVVLLGVAVFGIYVMPRANYDEIVAQMGANRRRIEEIDRLSEAHREATFSVIGSLPDRSTEFIDALGRMGETVAEFRTRLEQVEQRLDEDNGPQELAHSAAGKFSEHYLEHVNLSDEAAEKCLKIPTSSGLVQRGFESFVGTLCEAKMIPCDASAEVPDWAMRELSDLYSYFTMLIRLVERRQHLMVEGLVADAVVNGEYYEVPKDDEVALQRMLENQDKRPGVRRTVKISNEAKRYFKFAYEDYPDLNTSGAESNAKRHLVRDVAQLAVRMR